MRRIVVTAVAAAAVVLGAAVPASAAIVNRPWVPLPSAPFDLAAGAYCDFAVHADPTVDQVRTKVIEEYPDGSPKRQLATGALKFRMTNVATGTSEIVDAGGSAVFDYFPDGSRTWHVIGPVLGSFTTGAANIPRGVWTINGVYDVHFAPDNHKTITIYVGGVHDVCADLA